MRPSAAVVGAFHTPYRRRVDDQSLEEMVFSAVKGALADAHLEIGDIDAVILSTYDQASGRVIESMVTNGPAGGVDRDVTTLASAGEHALCYGHMRILAGQSKSVLVVVWSKESESLDLNHVNLLEAEPFLMRPLGIRSVVAAGLQASDYSTRYGYTEEAATSVRAARAKAAELAHDLPAGYFSLDIDSSMAAWPLTRADLPQSCDMAAAVVMRSADCVTEDQVPAWITGMGWSTEGYELADRDLCSLDSMKQAVAMTVEGRSIDQYDVIEVTENSVVAAFIAAEALGLAPVGKAGTDGVSTTATVNPSGGNLCVNPGNAAGFLRLMAAAQQVRGQAHGVQLEPTPKSAVGVSSYGFADQASAAMAFSSHRDGV